MNSVQENKKTMYYAVEETCKATQNIWQVLPAFVVAFNEFTSNLRVLEELLNNQAADITGATESKALLRSIMVEKAIQTASAVYTYYIQTGNVDKKNRVDFSRSDLLNIRDTASLDKCKLIHDEAQSILTNLGDYGVNKTELDDLQASIDAYKTQLSEPKIQRDNKKDFSSKIKETMSGTDHILHNKLDKLIEQFKTSNPEFYQKYKNARMIIDLTGKKSESKQTKNPL
jgi:hypothetical protein